MHVVLLSPYLDRLQEIDFCKGLSHVALQKHCTHWLYFSFYVAFERVCSLTLRKPYID